MFGLDPAAVTLIQGFFAAVISTGAAVLWGFWDRRRIDRKDKHESTLGEQQFLSTNIRQHLEDIKENRDYWEKLANERMHAEQVCYKDRDLVWAAFRSFADLAYEGLHEARKMIYQLVIEAGKDAKDYQIKDLPSIHTMYNQSKEQRDKENGNH